MKKITLILLLITFLFTGTSLALGAELKPQTHCPVMGGTIDKNVYADYQGQRVYFCCESCKKTFSEDPEKYLNKIK